MTMLPGMSKWLDDDHPANQEYDKCGDCQNFFPIHVPGATNQKGVCSKNMLPRSNEVIQLSSGKTVYVANAGRPIPPEQNCFERKS